MQTITCPTCREKIEDVLSPDVLCPACGNSLRGATGWSVSDRDFRVIARIHRQLAQLILAGIFAQVLAATAPSVSIAIVASICALAVNVAGFAQVVRLSAALGDPITTRVVWIILMLAPCISLFVLMSANRRAKTALMKAGLTVGVMGIGDAEVATLPGYCRNCACNMTRNTSGQCPECGYCAAE